ncbi:MAG: rod shape-determining protein MreC [Proteobacteria bacterium]|nr:rod shape-determining protein MreC [Pseudomonadota bacterium]
MRSRSRRRRTIVYMVFVVVALSLVGISTRFPAFTEGVHTYTVDRLAAVYKVLNAPVTFAKGIGDGIAQHFATVRKNRDLMEENQMLRAWRAEAMFLRVENDTLKELLNMVSDQSVTPITARVLADANTPYARTVLISAGRKHGVAKGQAVMGARGLVGRVLFTGQEASRVLLLSDPNARIPVKILESGQQAIMRGNNSRYPELILTEGDAALVAGHHVVTSGAGGIFAPGLPVGVVHDVTRVPLVRTYNSLSNLDLVVVQKRDVSGILGTEATGEDKQ